MTTSALPWWSLHYSFGLFIHWRILILHVLPIHMAAYTFYSIHTYAMHTCYTHMHACTHPRTHAPTYTHTNTHTHMHNLFHDLCIFTGLTDKVLESVVAKGSGELLSLDLSAVPHLLSDHALSVIGTYISCTMPISSYVRSWLLEHFSIVLVRMYTYVHNIM